MARNKTMLIIEDDIAQLHEYLTYARMTEYDPFGFSTVNEGIDFLKKKAVDVLITDIHLSEKNNQDTYEGMELLKYVKENHPEILSIAMSSDPKIDTFRQTFDNGAVHFLKKPIVSVHEIAIAVDLAKNRKFSDKVSPSFKKINSKIFNEFASKCEDGVVLPLNIRNTIKAVALNKKVRVVIYGETGTGKEIITKLIHRKRQEGSRQKIPFVAVNCSHLNADIAMSQLFGHKKGAFTGASETTTGYIGEADGGILFLDEIHTLSIECQQKLLRVLNDGVYEKIGDNKSLCSDFQVVVASTKDLDDAVDDGSFLMDLRGRLTGIDISLPPLRDRFDDLPYLIALFFARENVELPAAEILRIEEKCRSYYWRGNIRQLYRVLESLIVNSVMNNEPIKAENLPVFKTMFAPGTDFAGASKNLNPETLKTILEPFSKDIKLEPALEFYEKALIESSIARHETIAAAAASLGTSRSGLDLKRKKYSLID